MSERRKVEEVSVGLPGLSKRNGIYWYRPRMRDGRRAAPISLRTRSESKALRLYWALKIEEWEIRERKAGERKNKEIRELEPSSGCDEHAHIRVPGLWKKLMKECAIEDDKPVSKEFRQAVETYLILRGKL